MTKLAKMPAPVIHPAGRCYNLYGTAAALTFAVISVILVLPVKVSAGILNVHSTSGNVALEGERDWTRNAVFRLNPNVHFSSSNKLKASTLASALISTSLKQGNSNASNLLDLQTRKIASIVKTYEDSKFVDIKSHSSHREWYLDFDVGHLGKTSRNDSTPWKIGQGTLQIDLDQSRNLDLSNLQASVGTVSNHIDLDAEPLHKNETYEASNTDETEGIYWSNKIEAILPKGYNEADLKDWQSFTDQSFVVKMEEGCGRMQNRLVTFDGGTRSCCRYRDNDDQIQGEIFAFYLSILLRIKNIPPSTLSTASGHQNQWHRVRAYLQLQHRNEHRAVVLTQFVKGLSPAYIPQNFRNQSRRFYPTREDLENKTTSEMVELAQWSDLIVFDYLTANLDRVVNNMFNEQWNAEMMANPAHNLAKVSSTGLLVFLDNESGLLHGYRLLHKYERFHLSLLNSLCVFRRKTVEAIVNLRNRGDVEVRLKQMFERASTAVKNVLPFLPERNIGILNGRIERVYQHIRACEKQFGTGRFRWKTRTL